MFKNIHEAIKFIEHKQSTNTLDSFFVKLKKHHISINITKFIHVTGTNGKGSTVHYLSQMLQTCGYKVGTFTSPYIVSYHDRICINNIPISDENLLSLINDHYWMIVEENLSKFEIDVLLMLAYFKQEYVDYAVIEVGIGGLYDKTNIINSYLSLVTNIGTDHMPRLGTSLVEVARQKAGIIKPYTTLLTTEKNKECLSAIDTVVKKHHGIMKCCTWVVNDDYQIECLGYCINVQHIPKYQYPNIVLAVYAMKYLMVDISNEQIETAIHQGINKGRFEQLDDRLLVDGAHNVEAIEALIESLATIKCPITVIFCALKDKNYKQMIKLLQSHYPLYLTTFNDHRAIQLDEIEDKVEIFENFELAYDKAKKNHGLVVVTGSLHFVSDVIKKYSSAK